MLHAINLTIHIAAGTIAIFVALVPYFSEKGGPTHNRYGRLFLLLMGIVILTALTGVVFFRDRPFLTVVALQSFYHAFSGYRVLKIKNQGFQLVDFLVMLLVVGSAISFLIRIQNSNVVWHQSIVYYMLCYLFLIVGFDMLRYFFPKLISHPRFWVYEHIYKITGAFIGLVSAGTGNIFADWAPYNQIVPAVAGNFWLIFCLLYFPKYSKFAKRKPIVAQQAA